MLRFGKYEGIGNDFVVVDGAAPELAGFSAPDAAAVCDRHRGVGADGVLVVDLDGPRPRMTVWNADGSQAEMCGNGIRCVTLYLAHRGRLAEGETVVVDTAAGPHACRLVRAGETGEVEVTMVVPTLEPSRVPVVADAPLRDAPLALDGATPRVTAVSMGNPHAVTFDDLGEARLWVGPTLEKDARFPEGVNVGFATRDGDGLTLAVWERGSGWTRACGTGACAAAVAAVETGRAARGAELPVALPGGTLHITVGAPDAPVRMRGPARHVFDGELSLSRVRGESA